MKKKIISVLLAAVMACSLAAGCGGGSDGAAEKDTKAAEADKTLRITQSSGGVIDPGIEVDATSCVAYVNLYDSLVYIDLENESRPQLATDWDASADGLTWTFHLREDARFHDGTDVLASDVVFSMKRLLTMGEGFAYLFSNYVDDVEAADDHTVVFTLKQPFAPFLSILPRLYILNEDLVTEHIESGQYGEYGDYGKAYLAEHDAGSGAYQLSAIETGSSFTMTRFDDYYEEWDPDAPETVEVIMNTEAATIRTMMNNGELHITDQWQTNEAYEALSQIEGVEVGDFTNGQILYLMLNTKKIPTDDVHVRRALAFMLDYDQICGTLFPNYGKVSSSVPHNAFGFSPEGYDYTFDLEKAKEELKQSEYYDQLMSGEIHIEVEWISDVPDEEKIALLLQSTAAQLGVKVDVTKVPWATHVDKCGSIETTPNASTCFMAGDYSEAGAFLYKRFASDTAGTWQQCEWLQDAQLDAMISDALTTLDQTAREKAYAVIQKKVNEECLGIPIAEQAEKHAYFSNIEIPCMESAKNGGSTALPLGYNFMFKDYRIRPLAAGQPQ